MVLGVMRFFDLGGIEAEIFVGAAVEEFDDSADGFDAAPQRFIVRPLDEGLIAGREQRRRHEVVRAGRRGREGDLLGGHFAAAGEHGARRGEELQRFVAVEQRDAGDVGDAEVGGRDRRDTADGEVVRGLFAVALAQGAHHFDFMKRHFFRRDSASAAFSSTGSPGRGA